MNLGKKVRFAKFFTGGGVFLVRSEINLGNKIRFAKFFGGQMGILGKVGNELRE